jgi:hypothetical protein
LMSLFHRTAQDLVANATKTLSCSSPYEAANYSQPAITKQMASPPPIC